PQRKTEKLSIICEYFPEAMSLSSLRRTCSSSPALAGLAGAQPLVGQRVSSAGGVAVFRAKRSAVEVRRIVPARTTSVPRFFTVAPLEHLMAHSDPCQAPLNI